MGMSGIVLALVPTGGPAAAPPPPQPSRGQGEALAAGRCYVNFLSQLTIPYSPLIPQGEIHPERIVIIHALIHDIMPQPRAEDDRIDPLSVQRPDAEGEVDPT
jgi:hypothetical protein